VVISIGDKVQWNTLNGSQTGVVEGMDGKWMVVRLDNGMCIVGTEINFKKI